MQVSSKNWTLSNDTVTVELQATPASITPAFTTQDGTVCKPGAKPVDCTMPVPTKQAETLQVQVPVASSATSVTQVTLTALALPATAKLSGTLSASEAAQVTAAPAKKPSSSAAASTSPSRPNHTTSTVPLGPVGSGPFNLAQIPELNGAGSSVLGVGNASNLFPKISPSASPSPAPGANGAKKANADPPAKLSLLPLGMPVVTAQIIGLVALGVAFLLALTRLSLRRPAKPRRR